MTTELITIAARIREFISRSGGTGTASGSSFDEFNQLALQLFALQFAGNAPYRRICEARGVKPGSVESWAQIPAAPASAFKEFEMTCLAPAERTTVFHSSGTTAQRPSRHFHCAGSLALYEASLWAWFAPHVLGALVKADFHLVMLAPPPSAAPNSSLVHMFETIRNKSGMKRASYFGALDSGGAWMLAHAATEAALREASEDNTPVVVLGTAFNFVHLLDAMSERGIRCKFAPDSVVMETGGYKGRSRELAKAELHRFIAERLGVTASQIIREYGMSELSSQAYDSCGMPHASRRFQFPPWARAQIVSPETGCEVGDGETGLVRIFDLANAFSVLAVQTEDLAIRRGNGFELLGRATAAEPRGCSLMATELPGA